MLDQPKNIHAFFENPLKRWVSRTYKDIESFTREAIAQSGMLEKPLKSRVGWSAYRAAMLPKLLNGTRRRLCLNPLAHMPKTNCEKFSKALIYPIVPCDLCRSQDGLQRQQIKAILDGWEANSPGRRQIMFRALMNAQPSHLLDPTLFDFAELMRTSEKS